MPINQITFTAQFIARHIAANQQAAQQLATNRWLGGEQVGNTQTIILTTPAALGNRILQTLNQNGQVNAMAIDLQFIVDGLDLVIATRGNPPPHVFVNQNPGEVTLVGVRNGNVLNITHLEAA